MAFFHVTSGSLDGVFGSVRLSQEPSASPSPKLLYPPIAARQISSDARHAETYPAKHSLLLLLLII